jgi:ribonuclease P/MRP protein subunit RPP1
MFYDLNLPCPVTANPSELSRILSFSAELGYNCVALARVLSGKVPADVTKDAISLPLPNIDVPKSITLLTRITFIISDPSQNHRLSSLQPAYNVVALRPTNEKALALCCQSLECDLISLDLSVRLPFILKFKTVAAALQRGIRFEICYAGGVLGSGTEARRNLISGATALIRATRGRGIIISSEAKSAFGLRGPWDLVNLAAVWGLSQERGKEAVCEEARKVIQLARLKRESFRGVVDVVYGGSSPEQSQIEKEKMVVQKGLKRKAVDGEVTSPVVAAAVVNNEGKPLSKTQMKKRAKRARQEAAAVELSQPLNAEIPHETQQDEKS